MLRDARAVGHVTAFTVDAAGRECLHQRRELFEVLPNDCACSGTLYSALTGGLICAWTTGSKPNEWGYALSSPCRNSNAVMFLQIQPRVGRRSRRRHQLGLHRFEITLCGEFNWVRAALPPLFVCNNVLPPQLFCNNMRSYVYRFDAMTRLALTRWKIGSIIELVSAGSSLLCLTSSTVVLFQPQTGEGSLSYFEGVTKGRKSIVRGGVGAFYHMSKAQGGADVGVYEIELKGGARSVAGNAAVARRVSQVIATTVPVLLQRDLIILCRSYQPAPK
jgi:hypothetical protein